MGRATLGDTVVKRRARHANVSWSIAKNSFELPYVRAHLLNACPISVLGRQNVPVKLFFDDSKLVENARKAYESSLIKLEKVDKDLAAAKSREKDLRTAWKKAEDLFRSASKKASRDEKAKANAIKTLKMGADRARDVATKAKNELIWFLEHPAIFTGGSGYKESEILDKSILITQSYLSFLCLLRTLRRESLTPSGISTWFRVFRQISVDDL